MKRTVVWFVVVLMCLMVAAEAKDDKMGGGSEKAVAALEQQWIDAAKASNADALAPLLAEKFINTDSDGTVGGKAETLARTKAAKWESNQISNVKVTVFNDTAIATGDWAGKGKDSKGQSVAGHERWTDTWMKMAGGKWQCVASHSSPVKM